MSASLISDSAPLSSMAARNCAAGEGSAARASTMATSWSIPRRRSSSMRQPYLDASRLSRPLGFLGLGRAQGVGAVGEVADRRDRSVADLEHVVELGGERHLADLELAPEYGFESWPKLAHHVQGAGLHGLERALVLA